jgi:threonine dehydratase
VQSITPEDIAKTYSTIQPYLRRTPVVHADLGLPFGSVWFKLEMLQCAGSFKARGAFTNLLRRDIPEVGVVAASGGNHGVAVAYAAHRLGVPARIYVPTVSAPGKIARIRQLGAELVVGGDRYADALEGAQRWIAESGALSVHAFDQPETILGQGTLGLELTEQVEDLDTVLVPVGGGGLIAGVAAYLAGSVRVIGVEPKQAPTLRMARDAGRPVDAPTGGVAADALAPRRIGELVFPITERFVEDVVLVEEEAILLAQSRLWQELRVVAEPAASVGVAALLSEEYRPAPGERVAVVLSGANGAPPAELGSASTP